MPTMRVLELNVKDVKARPAFLNNAEHKVIRPVYYIREAEFP